MRKQPTQLREIGESRFVEISTRKSDLRNYGLVKRTLINLS